MCEYFFQLKNKQKIPLFYSHIDLFFHKIKLIFKALFGSTSKYSPLKKVNF
jgi:hypothetical protein